MPKKPAAETLPQGVAEIRKALIEQIRTWRERHSITQADLAAKCGVSVSAISMIERGERSPSYEMLHAIARALSVPVAELLRAEHGQAADDGHYRELVEFATSMRLSRRQVEQLIEVGRAIFVQPKGKR